MFAHGFKGRMISGLIRTGLATAERQTKAGSPSLSAVSGLLRPADGRWKTDREHGVAKPKSGSIAVQRERSEK
jgi:hypothetical protein